MPQTLNGFKKIREEKDKTVLRHEIEGHELHVNHKTVHPEHLKMLKALPMAEGDEAEEKPIRLDPEPGEVKPENIMSKTQGGDPARPPGGLGEKPAKPYAGGGKEGDPQPPQPDPTQSQNVLSTFEGNPDSSAAGPTGNPPPATSPADPNAGYQVPIVPTPLNPTAGIDMSIEGNRQMAAAEAGKAQQDVGTYHSAAVQGEAHEHQLARDLKDMQNEHALRMQDLADTHIDPERYMKSLGTGGKVATAIGLLLGGIGGGLTHQENPAMKYLQSRIDEDIESQKAELGKKQNLLSALSHQYGDRIAGESALRAMTTDHLINQINEHAAKAGTPIAKAMALQLNGPLQQLKDAQLQQAAQRQTFIRAAQDPNTDPAQLTQLNPNISPADKTAIDKEVSKSQALIQSVPNLMRLYQEADAAPVGPLRAEKIAALEREMLPHLKDDVGRINETELATQKRTFPSLIPLGNLISPEARKQRAADFAAGLNRLAPSPTAKRNGIDLSHYTSTSLPSGFALSPKDRAAYEYAKANPNTSEGKAISKILKQKNPGLK